MSPGLAKGSTKVVILWLCVQANNRVRVVKPISVEYRWSCLKRYIAFEDPAARWEKLIKLLGKHVYKSAQAGASFSQLPLEARRQVFNLVFSNRRQNSNSAAVFLNVCLALEDLARFQTATFELWLNKAMGEGSVGGGQIIDWAQEAWIDDLGLGGAKAAWVNQAAFLVPDWTCLCHPGPWSDDVRAQFIVHCLDIFPGNESNSGILVSDAQQVFRQTLGKWRDKLPGSFLPNVIVIVEGLTEAVLLPHLLRCLNVDADESGVLIVPAGGARQVVRRYSKWRDLVSLPILVILDKDAEVQAEVLRESLRTIDRLHILAAGEIEDIFDDKLLVLLVNEHLRYVGLANAVDAHELERLGRRTEVLNKIWRDRGLGNFDKIGFARTVVDYSLRPEHVSQDIKTIVVSIQELLGKTSVPQSIKQE